MPILYYFIFCLSFCLSIFCACKSAQTENTEKAITKPAEKLKQLLDEQSKLQKSIAELKASLATEGENVDKEQKLEIPLVRALKITPQLFQHFIHLQATVETDKSQVVMPSLGPGKVVKILVSLGEKVSKGQALLRLEDTIISAQIQTLETRLTFAKQVYHKQAELWKQKIGSEIEVLQRKNDVEALEGKIETLRRNRELSVITAPIAGVVDVLNLSVGDIFSGYAGNQAQLRIVNLSELKAAISVPDLYVQDLKIGSQIQLSFADLGLEFSTRIRNLSQYIDKLTRTFSVYAPLPSHKNLKINLIGAAKILDYQNPRGKILPIDLIYSDQQGKYVLILQKSAEDELYILSKRYVVLGKSYRNRVEICQGLNFGDIVLADNMPELTQGLRVRTNL